MIDQHLKSQAITAALAQHWEEAVTLNTELLQLNENDIETLNRIGFAYLKLGKITEAKKAFQKVISLDTYNPIAKRNLQKLATIKASDILREQTGKISPSQFLEEPGVTKIVQCVNVAPLQTVCTVSAGQEVIMKIKNHAIEIRTTSGLHLGQLPDDIAFKMQKLLEAGNKYQVSVKATGKNLLTVIIREIERSAILSNQPSFISSSLPYTSYSKAEGETPVPDTTATGEEESQ